MVIDHLAARCGVDWQHQADVQGQVVRVGLGGREVLLVKPQSYMNHSGRTAAALCAQWEVLPEDVLVIFDDFLLNFGCLRFRRGGSDGGHNGLASVLEALNTKAVPRLRLGIGIPPAGADVSDYVLSPFSPEDEVEDLVEYGNAALEVYYAEGIEAAMNRFNGQK